MSSYICDDITYNRIYGFFMNCKYSTDVVQSEVRSLLVEHHILERPKQPWMLDTTRYDEAITSLMNALYSMNVNAVNERYNDRQEAFTVLHLREESAPLIQTLKSMHCLKYQCNEGDIDQMPLFKFLHAVIHAIELHVINQIPEYAIAEWQ